MKGSFPFRIIKKSHKSLKSYERVKRKKRDKKFAWKYSHGAMLKKREKEEIKKSFQSDFSYQQQIDQIEKCMWIC